MTEYIEEEQRTPDGGLLNPFAIILALVLLAALVWWIFVSPRSATPTPIHTQQTTTSGTTP